MVELDQFIEALGQVLPSIDYDPPFEETYKALFQDYKLSFLKPKVLSNDILSSTDVVIEQCELPLIDLSRLNNEVQVEREECMVEMAKASTEWGFFQVVNHGVSREVLDAMRTEQMKLFREPFYKKVENDKYMNMSKGSYRWGTPTAASLDQLSWSEAFHILMTDAPRLAGTASLRLTMKEFSTHIFELAQRLAKILAQRLGQESTFIEENCLPNTCYIRMNRYPPCPRYSQLFGLMAHTDSDFLTILHQDEVGGLQLVKDGKWIAVKPNPDALIVNIGDLFQAWSNGTYKSVEHRVVANAKTERFSTAFFLCPSINTVIESCKEPSVYRKFSFKEFRQQVEDDVRNHGRKIGLSRFLGTLACEV
ncbi:hypothetical protein Droror1_Dr00016572 [Drosera rotundifolia]